MSSRLRAAEDSNLGPTAPEHEEGHSQRLAGRHKPWNRSGREAGKVHPSHRLPGFRQDFTAPLLPPAGGATAGKAGREKGVERYLTVREVADLLQVSTATIYDAVKRGGLAHVRVPGNGLASNDYRFGNAMTKRTLLALNADDLRQTLWSSDTNSGDVVGSAVYWNPPIIVNGKVYLATYFTTAPTTRHYPNSFGVLSYGPRNLWTIIPGIRNWATGLFSHYTLKLCTKCAIFTQGLTTSTLNLGSDGGLWFRPRINGAWSTPTEVAPANVAPPGAGLAGDLHGLNQLDMFVVDNNGALNVVSETTAGWQAPVTHSPANFAPTGAPVTALAYGGQTAGWVVTRSERLRSSGGTPCLAGSGPRRSRRATSRPPART